MKNQEKIKLPNFLIVGTAKSATTSMYYYLKQHPDVFFSSVKEPYFFSSQAIELPFGGVRDDEIEKLFIKDWNDYKKLFRDASEEKAIGEASVDCLYYYKECIPLIKKYLRDPKIIIMLRNPVDRAFSHFSANIREGIEKFSFEDSLAQEEKRIRENWSFRWHYQKVGFYYEQVKAYLENFSNVKVILMEDVKKKPEDIIKETFNFLNVDPEIAVDYKFKYNVSGIPKNNILSKLMTSSLTKARFQYLFLLRVFSINEKKGMKNSEKKSIYREKIVRFTESIKQRNMEKPEMNRRTREKLMSHYVKDIDNLQKIINRDLSHWK